MFPQSSELKQSPHSHLSELRAGTAVLQAGLRPAFQNRCTIFLLANADSLGASMNKKHVSKSHLCPIWRWTHCNRASRGLGKRRGAFLCACLLSRVRPSATPWTAARQSPLSVGFPRQEYCGGLLFLSPEDLPELGIEPASLALAGGFFTTEPPGKS